MTVEHLLKNLREKADSYRVAGIVLNNEVAMEAIAILEQEQGKPTAPIYVIEDQVIPANSPEISEAQQKRASIAREMGAPYLYGQTMASHYLLGIAKSGEVFAGSDGDIAMVGAKGALGIAVDASHLAVAMKTGMVELPLTKVLSVLIKGRLPQGLDCRDAAGYMVQQFKDLVDDATIVEFSESEGVLSIEDKALLCGWTQKLGALSAAFVTEKAWNKPAEVGGIGPEVKVEEVVLDLERVTSLLEGVEEQPIDAVFIGGAYGGTLDAIRQVAEALKNKKVAYKVRLSVAPASADIYVAAANAGYLTTIIDAEGLVLNQCAMPPVQARIGESEVLVSNDIHNEKDYAGVGGIIYLASTRAAIRAALTGKLGGEA